MKSTNSRLISAKEISEKFKLPYPTVNHYTNLGLFSVVKRKGNVRLYREREVKKRLDKISRWKDEGYPLRLILKLLKKEK
jgi:DNA-binding transcriptional MerR regulator